MRATDPAHRHDRLALRLSVIISRLLTGESLSLKTLSDEFGVSERTLRRDFSQRLLHLDLTGDNGFWRLRTNPMRDHTPGALAFARNTGIARLIPSQSRQLMQLLMNENGTSPCLIGHVYQPAGIRPDCFQRLAESIYHHRMVSLLVKGIHHDYLEPYRLIFSHAKWYLVACRKEVIQVFSLDEIISVSLSEQNFKHRNETSALIVMEDFINALPHFHFISNVMHTFREHSPETHIKPKGVKT
ncbi:WYL domain-containing protein [Enterobacter cloacae]|uniref:helix-turn-helix transcriptional regulator n=1 Tax=Enterobacter TaxID=547 RepID=UPI0021C65592|nr:WYL domain-containing protein [Enterobacter ludwigii]ELE9014894.1 WYL domain-containing protein [Enterobacter cloacae]ELV2770489.1 WYL domain-containing protein [Enterobacter cloacae]ELV2779620.1 WYL domain-containing protein [Enterobacter cloacae]ELV3373048.1 WYL domain-containing protein [Enterobacter cloacae]MCU2394336.1 WYL domain-containing protein [Enterobacter ludwigii]